MNSITEIIEYCKPPFDGLPFARNAGILAISMQIIHPINLLSQIRDIKSRAWKRRACGIVSLCMVMNHYAKHISKQSLQSLIDRGVTIGAYKPGIGWTHQGLLNIAQEYGFIGERFDYAHTEPQEALQLLLSHVQYGPVIASIHKGFNPKNGGHLIVVNGYTTTDAGTTIYIVDPMSKKKKRNVRLVSQNMFINGWKKRFIVISPQQK